MKKLPVLIVALFLIAAGCGGDDDDKASTTETGGTVASLSVSETEYKLDPANPTIDRAGTVELNVENNGKIDHALEVEGPGGEVKTGTIAAGESAALKVDLSRAGTYEWYCPIGNHRDLGMEGGIEVAGGGTATTPTGTGTTETGTTETETGTTETGTTETGTTETKEDTGGAGSGGSNGSGGSGGSDDSGGSGGY